MDVQLLKDKHVPRMVTNSTVVEKVLNTSYLYAASKELQVLTVTVAFQV